MKVPRTALALFALAALAACGDSAAITGVVAPARPAFDAGGFGMGSGGVVPTDTTQSGPQAHVPGTLPEQEGEGRVRFDAPYVTEPPPQSQWGLSAFVILL
jgi:hypothetical protein